MKSYAKYLAISYVILLACCKKDQNLIFVSGFPVKIGDSWTYQRVDSVNNIVDTIIISIPATLTYNNKLAYLWVQTSKSSIDTSYLSINGDTISILNQFNEPTDIFLFPLQNGSSWSATTTVGGAPDNYSCSVESSDQISGVNYSNVFVLNRLESGFDLSLTEKVELVNNVGIVSYQFHQNNSGQVTIYKLTLLSYHLI